jgi:beta-lactamase class A
MSGPASRLAALDASLAAMPGTISVWYGGLGGPATYRREENTTHYAASMMKIAVLAALHRHAEAGRLGLDTLVPVRNEFASAAPGAPAFGCRRRNDADDAVWDRLGGTASLRWLAERMIVRSSNLAANLVLAHVGVAAVAEVWRAVDARQSAVVRPIEDRAAAEAGLANVVTAADLAALMAAIALGVHSPGPLAAPVACAAMTETLCAQERTEDLAAGLPPGTRVAHKNGWVSGVRHAAGVVYPADAPPFVLAVCASTPVARNRRDDEACQLVARIAAAAWSDRSTRVPSPASDARRVSGG